MRKLKTASFAGNPLHTYQPIVSSGEIGPKYPIMTNGISIVLGAKQSVAFFCVAIKKVLNSVSQCQCDECMLKLELGSNIYITVSATIDLCSPDVILIDNLPTMTCKFLAI